MLIVPEYQKDYYKGESLEEVIRPIRAVAKRRIANRLYWKDIEDLDSLMDLFLHRPCNFYEERLLEITRDVVRAYLMKLSENYKEYSRDWDEACEDYKILDALISINNNTYFTRLCYDLKDDLNFEI